MLVYGKDDREPLSEKFLAVLYRFVRPKTYEDSIANVERFNADEIESMQLFGPRGLGSLLAKVAELRKQ